MNTRLLFNVSAAIEILTGVTMLIVPALVIELLLGEGLGPTGVAVTRILGVGLLSLGIAGWNSQEQGTVLGPQTGLLVYNIGATALFVFLGTIGAMGGLFLWPAAGLHLVISVLMLGAIIRHHQE
jgi:hypothetical protein